MCETSIIWLNFQIHFNNFNNIYMYVKGKKKIQQNLQKKIVL